MTEPMPSMPLFLWNDPTGERLHDSYFAMYPGIWRHGDWIRITPRGGAVIYGRSDSTINRQGVRMGTSEIYRAAARVPAVLDALVVDIPGNELGDELKMILFVVLADGVTLGDELERAIKAAIREDCSPRHVPNEIRQIDQVPRTLSGKVLEVPVKRILTGTPPEQAASRRIAGGPGGAGLLRGARARARCARNAGLTPDAHPPAARVSSSVFSRLRSLRFALRIAGAITPPSTRGKPDGSPRLRSDIHVPPPGVSRHA